MGTFVELKIISPKHTQEELSVITNDVLQLARNLEQKFTIFDSSSELNALNIKGSMQVSSELFELVEKAIEFGELSEGAFDITVSPILKESGFYHDMPASLRDRIPNDYKGIGWDNVVLDRDTETITLKNNAWLDLSGIAGGYIVDRMADMLKAKGINSFLINDGGDIYCGEKDTSSIWNIGIKNPARSGTILTLGLKNIAISTSGDYENVLIEKNTGQTISHIIDPVAKEAKKKLSSSVTVVAPTCLEADALATGMFVMGPDRAIKLAEARENIEIIFVEFLNGSYKFSYSKDARKYILER